MKAKYVFVPLTLVIILAVLAGYFVSLEFASDAAEKKMTQTLSLLQPQMDNMAISYGEVRSNPFLSNITFKNLNIVIKNDEKQEENTLSAEKLTIDLSSSDYKKFSQSDLNQIPEIEGFTFIAEKLKVADKDIKNFLFLEKISLKFDGEMNFQTIGEVVEPEKLLANKIAIELKLKDLKVKLDQSKKDELSGLSEGNPLTSQNYAEVLNFLEKYLDGNTPIVDKFNVLVESDPASQKLNLKKILVQEANSTMSGDIALEFRDTIEPFEKLQKINLDLKTVAKNSVEYTLLDNFTITSGTGKSKIKLFLELNESEMPLEDFSIDMSLSLKGMKITSEGEPEITDMQQAALFAMLPLEFNSIVIDLDANMKKILLNNFTIESNLLKTTASAEITPDLKTFSSIFLNSFDMSIEILQKELEPQFAQLKENPMVSEKDGKYIISAKDMELMPILNILMAPKVEEDDEFMGDYPF
ncbi:MAG: hypothetical protein JXR63_06065 [Spirochaetales bacterium]|nr:hypothetical protein [Spirochaetales bacterium]